MWECLSFINDEWVDVIVEVDRRPETGRISYDQYNQRYMR